MTGITVDITEARQWKPSENGGEAGRSTLNGPLPDGLIVINESGTVESVNPAVAAMFGYTVEELVGGNVSRLIPEPHRSRNDGYTTIWPAGKKKSLHKSRQVQACHRDGSYFDVALLVGEVRTGQHSLFSGLLCKLDAAP